MPSIGRACAIGLASNSHDTTEKREASLSLTIVSSVPARFFCDPFAVVDGALAVSTAPQRVNRSYQILTK